MARIIVFGGHGRVARHLTRRLARHGDQVTAVIRNPEHADDVTADGALPRVEDVEELDLDDLTALVRGHDAVVWSAGAGGGNRQRTYAVDRDAAVLSMRAARAAGIGRYMMVSWLGSRADHGVPAGDAFYPYADAKWSADRHLIGSELDWTIVAPGTLTTEAGTGRIVLDPDDRGRVSRADVATVIDTALRSRATVRRTLRFGNGADEQSRPIAEALAG